MRAAADKPGKPLAGGITLIELLVTLGVISLVLLLTPPLFGKSIDSAKIRASTFELSSALRKARLMARNDLAEVPLFIDTDKNTYSIGSNEVELKLPSGAKLTLSIAEIEKMSEVKGGIRFFPDGSATGGKITITGSRTRYVIDVNWLTGKVSVSP